MSLNTGDMVLVPAGTKMKDFNSREPLPELSSDATAIFLGHLEPSNKARGLAFIEGRIVVVRRNVLKLVSTFVDSVDLDVE
jgi:hypothetical protein